MQVSLPYSKQNIDQADIDAVVKTLQSDYLTQGPAVKKFEDDFSSYVGSQYCVAVNSGTAALHAAYAAVGLSKGDEIITSPITFAATSNAALYLGAKVVFADVEEDTGNIDLDHVLSLVTTKTKIISVIHYAGQPVDVKILREKIDVLNKKRKKEEKIHIIEDACHAIGAEVAGDKIGSCTYSDATVYSFHPVKHITTGEGGAITTNDEDIYMYMMMFRTHGITKDAEQLIDTEQGSWFHEMQILGFNYRLADFQAALGSSQLQKVEYFVEERKKLAEMYFKLLSDYDSLLLPPKRKETIHTYHLFPVRLKGSLVKKKKDIFEKLRVAGLWVQVHYIPTYLHPYYQKLGYKKGLCPRAEDFYDREISIPLYPGMKKEDVELVVETLKKVIADVS